MFVLFLCIIPVIYLITKWLLNKHYWFKFHLHFEKNKHEKNKFFTQENSISKSINIEKINKDQLIQLYKDYFPSFNITVKTIENYFNDYTESVLLYKEEKGVIIGAVFNSINNIVLRGKKYRANFVDYACISKKNRGNNLFQEFMYKIADHSNRNSADLIIFKVDIKPIPSYQQYSFMTSYFLSTKENLNKIICKNKFQIMTLNETHFSKINSYFWNNFIFFPNLSENTYFKNMLSNSEERITYIIDEKIILSFRYISDNNLELLYSIFLEEDEEMLKYGISYLCKKYNFEYLLIEDIGDNGKVIKYMGNFFELNHRTYHYVLGSEEKLSKEQVIY